MTETTFYEKYGETVLFFDSYYKFKFTWKGVCEVTGHTVWLTDGGSSEEIYRYEVSADVGCRVDGFKGTEYSAEVKDGKSLVTRFSTRVY